MPDINVLTVAQMQALTDAGLAHPQHETVATLIYYDGSWWAYASKKDNRDASYGADGAVWFRTGDIN